MTCIISELSRKVCRAMSLFMTSGGGLRDQGELWVLLREKIMEEVMGKFGVSLLWSGVMRGVKV